MRRNWIEKCLNSLRDSTLPTIPIVVDNASTDATRHFVPEHFPEAVWLPQDTNLGFGKANNIGMRYAFDNGADYVFLLNQDATVHPRALQRMIEQSDGKSLITPMQLNGNGTALDAMFGQIVRKTPNTLIDDAVISNSRMLPYYNCGCIAAASWLLPREIISNLGGFNPLFHHYGEDNNYHQRLVYHGYKTRMVPDAYMYHDRQLHGDTALYNKTRLKREMMIAACDINSSFTAFLKYWIKTLVRCWIILLPQRKYIPGGMMTETIALVAKARKIAKGRKADRQRGMHWL